VSSAAQPEATDPVCGMKVDPAAPKGGSFEHAGRTWYFCSAKCRARFAADPAAYLTAKPAPAPVSPAAGRWTCPMDPEVVLDHPGPCPKCGMALEPLTITAEEGESPELGEMRRRLVVSTALTVPLLVIAMGGMAVGLHGPRTGWIELGLSTPVVLWGAGPSSCGEQDRSCAAA